MAYFTAYWVPAGFGPNPTNLLIPLQPISPNQTWDAWPFLGHILAVGDQIAALYLTTRPDLLNFRGLRGGDHAMSGRNFLRLHEGLDVVPLLIDLARQPDLWNAYRVRTFHEQSAHRLIDDVILRYNRFDDGDDFVDKVCSRIEVENYPPFARLLPARLICMFLMQRVGGEHLGRVFISRMAPGTAIPPHTDRIAPAEEAFPDRIPPAIYYDHYYVCLQSAPGGDLQLRRRGSDHACRRGLALRQPARALRREPLGDGSYSPDRRHSFGHERLPANRGAGVTTFHVESWADYRRECGGLWEAHYQELALRKDRMKMKPDEPACRALDAGWPASTSSLPAMGAR